MREPVKEKELKRDSAARKISTFLDRESMQGPQLGRRSSTWPMDSVSSYTPFALLFIFHWNIPVTDKPSISPSLSLSYPLSHWRREQRQVL